MKTLILSSKDVEKHVNAELAVNSVNYVFVQQGKGGLDMPPKIHIDMSRIGHESWCNAMPAYIAEQEIGGIKWIGGFGNNQRLNLPYIMGIIILTDPSDGQVLSIMDGRRISDLRTGASAAIFARYLAVSPLNEILVVGAGVQGMNAIQCLLLEYPDSLIRVYDINKEKAELLKENFPANSKKKIIVSDNLEEATKSSKLIALLTTSQKPFLKNEWISPGATVLGMGTYQQIFEDFTLSADKIVPDSWVQAVGRGELKSLFNAGKITQKNCFSEIGKIATGFSKGRENDEERILGLPVGIGAHDVCMAYKIYNEAVKNQEGVWIELQ